MRPLLLALALARAAALLDSPGLRGTTQSVVDEAAEAAWTSVLDHGVHAAVPRREWRS